MLIIGSHPPVHSAWAAEHRGELPFDSAHARAHNQVQAIPTLASHARRAEADDLSDVALRVSDADVADGGGAVVYR